MREFRTLFPPTDRRASHNVALILAGFRVRLAEQESPDVLIL
jgi:hypothetical protein